MSMIYYANHQDSARGYAREFMLSKEEAYLKKVYDGTADASRLNMEYKVVTGNQYLVTYYRNGGGGRYYTGQNAYDVLSCGAENFNILCQARVRIDTTPVTDWIDVIVGSVNVRTFDNSPHTNYHGNNNS